LKKESTIVIGQQQATRIANNVGFLGRLIEFHKARTIYPKSHSQTPF
jgi:ABC-type phosphate transport system ATPase subunit